MNRTKIQFHIKLKYKIFYFKENKFINIFFKIYLNYLKKINSSQKVKIYY